MTGRRCGVVVLVAGTLAMLSWSPCRAGPAGEGSLDAAPRYAVDPSWPQKPAEFTWAAMPGIAVDGQDNVYIFTRSRPSVQIYRPDGSLVRAWNTDNPPGAHHIEIGPEGNVWTTDMKNHVVQKYTPKGKLLLTLGEAGVAGDDERHFGGPTDVAVLPGGEIFVSDGYGNRRVVHFDKSGKFVKQWGSEGQRPGEFALPHAIAADSKGRLYVADRENARIQVFDTQGKLLKVWEKLITPWGFHMTEQDELWVCGASPERRKVEDRWAVVPPPDQLLMKLNTKGEALLRVPLAMTATPPGKPGELNWVHGVAIDSQGNLYLGDIQGKRAQKFSPR